MHCGLIDERMVGFSMFNSRKRIMQLRKLIGPGMFQVSNDVTNDANVSKKRNLRMRCQHGSYLQPLSLKSLEPGVHLLDRNVTTLKELVLTLHPDLYCSRPKDVERCIINHTRAAMTLTESDFIGIQMDAGVDNRYEMSA